MFTNYFKQLYFFGLKLILASSYLSSSCLGKIGLNWALTGSITNWGKSKSIFESYSWSLASFVFWSVPGVPKKVSHFFKVCVRFMTHLEFLQLYTNHCALLSCVRKLRFQNPYYARQEIRQLCVVSQTTAHSCLNFFMLSVRNSSLSS